jgi:hypothetical protein
MAHTILVDFDKTIHPYSKGWNNGELEMYEQPIEGSEEFLLELLRLGYNVCIFTTRADTDNGRHAVESYLILQMPRAASALLSDAPAGEDRMWVSNVKHPSTAIVDDRAINPVMDDGSYDWDYVLSRVAYLRGRR